MSHWSASLCRWMIFAWMPSSSSIVKVWISCSNPTDLLQSNRPAPTDMFQPTCSDRHDSIDRVLSFYQLSANVNWLWSWLYRPLEIRTKVRLDPQKNRPDFYNLINAQPTRRQCIQHKINNSILLPLIKLHICSHMMHQNFWSEVGTGSTKWWSTSSVGSM